MWEFDLLCVEDIVQRAEKLKAERIKHMEESKEVLRPGKRINPLSWFADAVSRYRAKRVEKVRYGRCYMYMQWDRERIDEYWEFPSKEKMEGFKKEYYEISPNYLRDLPNNFVVAVGKIWQDIPENAKCKGNDDKKETS